MRERLPKTPYREAPATIHGRGCDKRYAVIHDTEGGDVRSVEAWFRGGSGGQGTGAHMIVDDQRVVQIAPLDALLYHAPGGNTNGVGFELCGYASYSKLQWRARRKQRLQTARRVAWLCYVNGWGQPRRGRNVFAHGDFPPPNDHTDPGPNFPWGIFMSACRRSYKKLQRSHGRKWK